ncbi:OmpA family protein [Flavobacterium oncorhynchi]|uniref:OmpA family protein n=1 Tax=Flavobacterium oncorhynchi TaxID=728056 RepID=UPI00351A52BC
MKYRLLFLFAALIFFLNIHAQKQSKDIKNADKLFNNYAYFDAIKIYEKVAENGYLSVELVQKLADANFFNAQYIDANRWYEKLFELNEEVEKIYYFRYAQTLKAVSDYKRSNEYMQKFSWNNKKNDIAVQFLNNNDYLESLSRIDTQYKIEKLSINSIYSDYGVSFSNGSFIFGSSRKSNKKLDPRTNEYYTSLYAIKDFLSNTSEFTREAELISITKQSKFNESTPVFSSDGKTMYFTKGEYFYPKRNSPKKRVELKIYTAKLSKRGKWKRIKQLSIDNNEYNCAHPALSSDEKSLYFVSDMPGGFGDTDIYKIALEDNKTVGKAINLGSNINTSGKESYPFVSAGNELFFSSNGHLGLGGLDIFKSQIDSSKTQQKAVNLGAPLNSSFDDFCFLKLNNSNAGYFSSNRPDGMGKDDIYRFEEKKDSIVNFTFLDQETQTPLENLAISVYDRNHNLIKTGTVNKEGQYSTSLNQYKDFVFYIEIKGPGYGTQEITFTDSDSDRINKTTFSVLKSLQRLELGIDLSKSLIKPIYFSVDKYEIRKEAEVELQKLIEFMKEYTSVNIEVRSHTDSRLSTTSNMELSLKRAQSVKKYLIKNNISSKKIAIKYYGESQLVNHCSDGVPCSEIEHKENRRCEFVITKL